MVSAHQAKTAAHAVLAAVLQVRDGELAALLWQRPHDLYTAALGYDVGATNLQRILLRRGLLDPIGARREAGPAGGRPAELYRFRTHTLAITDQFAILRPPTI